MQDKLDTLKTRLGRVADLSGAYGLLSWDQETMMPAGGLAARADQISTLSSLHHELFTSEEVGALLEDLAGNLDGLDYDSDEASIIRVNWRNYQKQVRVPAALVAEISKASAIAKQSWKQARAESDFSIFAPDLTRMVALQIEMAAALGADGNPYDALLDRYEPGLSFADIDAVFSAIKPQLIDLIQAIGENAGAVDDAVLRRAYPQADQIAFSKQVCADIGFDFNKGRFDLSTHPFTSGAAYTDVRLTTRINEHFLPSCVMASIHEAGHGIHRQQLSPTLYRTNTERYGLAVAESQSRFYENLIGLSRAFWQHYYPKLQATFPHLQDTDLDTFYKAINKSYPSLIRTEADEVTYGMHIMLRFEIENALINGRVQVADLPEMWNQRMQDYLGIVPPNDSQGVLQDIHWSMGGFGYFPDYLLGSILSSQLWDALLAAHPDTVEQVAAGEFATVTAWLGENVQQHGGKFTFLELAEKATGRAFTSQPYIDYLTAKYGEIYGL